MAKNDQQEGFTEVQHALLFALLGKAVVERVGEARGEEVMRGAVRVYGRERGRRMALRAQANGHALSMDNYLAYSEYQAASRETRQKVLERVPHARVCVAGCSWHSTWKENGLLPYGRYYCLEIDEAVVGGFNPDLHIEVVETQTNGAEQCQFVFHDANLTLKNYLSIAYKKAVRPGKRAVLPWEYHIGHLFATLEKVIVAELGESGQAAVAAGLAEFAQRCGEAAAQVAAAGRKVDTTRLPDI